MDALERYYNEYLLGYNAGSNISWYDADYQLTMDRIELILDKGYMDGDDARICPLHPPGDRERADQRGRCEIFG